MKLKNIWIPIDDKARLRSFAHLQETTVSALVRHEINAMVKLGAQQVPPIPPAKRMPASERVKLNFFIDEKEWDAAQQVAYESHVSVPDFVRTKLMGRVVRAGL